MFNLKDKIPTSDFDGHEFVEQEIAPSWRDLIQSNFSLEKGLLSNILFAAFIVVILSLNISIRDKIGMYRAQSELVSKDIHELEIEQDASLYRMENINKKDRIVNTLDQHHIDIHESNVPNKVLLIQ